MKGRILGLLLYLHESSSGCRDGEFFSNHHSFGNHLSEIECPKGVLDGNGGLNLHLPTRYIVPDISLQDECFQNKTKTSGEMSAENI